MQRCHIGTVENVAKKDLYSLSLARLKCLGPYLSPAMANSHCVTGDCLFQRLVLLRSHPVGKTTSEQEIFPAVLHEAHYLSWSVWAPGTRTTKGRTLVLKCGTLSGVTLTFDMWATQKSLIKTSQNMVVLVWYYILTVGRIITQRYPDYCAYTNNCQNFVLYLLQFACADSTAPKCISQIAITDFTSIVKSNRKCSLFISVSIVLFD